jgi:hypothetical protein
LEARDEPTNGNKKQLIERLENSLEEVSMGEVCKTSSPPAKRKYYKSNL